MHQTLNCGVGSPQTCSDMAECKSRSLDLDTEGLLCQSDSCQKERRSHLPWAHHHCVGAAHLCCQGTGHCCCQLLLPKLSVAFLQSWSVLGCPSACPAVWISLTCRAVSLVFSCICTESMAPLPVCTSPKFGLWGYSVGMGPHSWLLPQPRFIGFPYSQFEMIYEQIYSSQARIYIARSMIE